MPAEQVATEPGRLKSRNWGAWWRWWLTKELPTRDGIYMGYCPWCDFGKMKGFARYDFRKGNMFCQPCDGQGKRVCTLDEVQKHILSVCGVDGQAWVDFMRTKPSDEAITRELLKTSPTPPPQV